MESAGVFSLTLGFQFPIAAAARWFEPTWGCSHGSARWKVNARRRHGPLSFCSHEKAGTVPGAPDCLPAEVFTCAPCRHAERRYCTRRWPLDWVPWQNWWATWRKRAGILGATAPQLETVLAAITIWPSNCATASWSVLASSSLSCRLSFLYAFPCRFLPLATTALFHMQQQYS